MRILFVQHMDAISGSELYLLQLLPELKRRGFYVEMLIAHKIDTGRNAPFVKQLADHGIMTHVIYGHSPYSLQLLSKIKKITKAGSFDLVQSNLIHADLWMAMIKCFSMRKMKLLSVKHGYDESYAAKYGFNTKKINRSLFTWVQRFSGIWANRNLTISKGIYNLYVKGKISKPSKIRNVYYGLDLSHIRNSGFEKTDDSRYAIILGRLVRYKGHEYVIRAWQKLKAHDPSLKLYIVGGGTYQENLVRLTKELGLEEQVIFKGYQPNPHELLHFSAFSVVSSIFEGFGLITLESWHHKRPVIAFDVPAPNEVVDDGVNGLLVKPFDTDELAAKMIRLFSNPGEASQMGENGYEKLQKAYSLDRMTNETIEEYEKLVNHNK